MTPTPGLDWNTITYWSMRRAALRAASSEARQQLTTIAQLLKADGLTDGARAHMEVMQVAMMRAAERLALDAME